MTNKINISIPKPCHENWQQMTPEDQGRFCASCQKKVHDFTKSSDHEIVKAFQQNKNLCGRFLNSQLNRDLIKPKEKSSVWLATTATMVSLVGIGTNEVLAQEPVKTEQTDSKVLGKFLIAPQPKEIEVSGIVSDDNGFPFPGVNVTVKGKTISTQTDFDGKFTIKTEKGDTLVFSFVGTETKEVLADRSQINMTLKEDNHLMGEIIIVKKRTFFGRIFYSIGNWFR